MRGLWQSPVKSSAPSIDEAAHPTLGDRAVFSTPASCRTLAFKQSRKACRALRADCAELHAGCAARVAALASLEEAGTSVCKAQDALVRCCHGVLSDQAAAAASAGTGTSHHTVCLLAPTPQVHQSAAQFCGTFSGARSSPCQA